jgi:hypothetical protein
MKKTPQDKKIGKMLIEEYVYSDTIVQNTFLNFRQLNGPGSHATYLARIQVRYCIKLESCDDVL